MGVKSLWTLLTPVGRPVMLETMEGKIVAIDSSIWIYQFQATMRAKDGRALVNAHVLGFLRRICKLLFYGMKPVFVFDGGAPVLKRETLNERRKKKIGAAASHVKLAERLLAAQLRREALKHVKTSPTKGKGKAPELADAEEEIVYLEDIDSTIPTTPHRKEKTAKESTSSGKKNKFYDHDPYRLPEINLEERIAEATRSSAPDPRLATEEELRSFIENMRPEDFDVTSAAFRELPTEVQYEIVGDLRLKSRQTSYTRLQQMLKSAPTPLDFSKQQIKNLKQRNSLTQQLLTTTDSIGKAHISIPVRIASERNREYMLIRNEGPTGGWILGIRDEGTKQKPIVIDHEEEHASDLIMKDSDEDEMEEVNIPAECDIDPDLRNYRRQSALTAIAGRYSPKPLAPLSTKAMGKSTQIPLFDFEQDDEVEDFPMRAPPDDVWEEDEELAFAIQESIEYSSKASLPMNGSSSSSTAVKTNPGSAAIEQEQDKTPSSSRSRLETALSIANAGPSSSTSFGQPFLLTARKSPLSSTPKSTLKSSPPKVSTPKASPSVSKLPLSSLPKAFSPSLTAPSPIHKSDTLPTNSTLTEPVPSPISQMNIDVMRIPLFGKSANEDANIAKVPSLSNIGLSSPAALPPPDGDDDMEEVPVLDLHTERELIQEVVANVSDPPTTNNLTVSHSKSPSPDAEQNHSRPPTPPAEEEDWDAAHEMNPDAEEGDFAQFVSQVKGRNIDDVRREIDDEIASLDQQKRNAMRDAEDVNQQMVTQIMIMLRLFGIPYITAPMEAEAQCAELLTLNLVDGIITDDSDVFLFGGYRVFKNMFNQSKTVECFLLSDLDRELGLDQATLIQLAYLLGSDYVEGLQGVGPVVAMELLEEFPGDDGLHKFKDWWLKVQSGKDHEDDNKSPFRKRFKKKFKDLFLPADWPNAAVRDAYYHPTVDDSDEPFKWGLPDLDALRAFLHEELGWGQTKVDDLLLPIIQKVGKRGQVNALNRQGNLNTFFDMSAGSGTAAPKKRQAYASKRLQQVVSDFRKRKNAASSAHEISSNDEGEDREEEEAPSVKKKPRVSRKDRETMSTKGSSRGKKVTRGRRAPRGQAQTGRKNKESSVEDDEDEYGPGSEPDKIVDTPPLAVNLRPRPKPKPIGKSLSNRAGSIDV